MKPAKFDYACADTVEDVVSVLGEHGADARVLAGGQSLLPMLSMRLSRPQVVVDITRVSHLQGMRIEDGHLFVGAAATQGSLANVDGLAEKLPLMQSALPWIGHYQTRLRGTVVGSLAHADPSAELPLCLVALDGEVNVRSSGGSRRVSATDFFQGTMLTALNDDEFIESARFPIAAPSDRHAFAEVGRRHGDFAIVAAAATADNGGVHLTIGGVNDVPFKQTFSSLEPQDVDDAVNEVFQHLDARSDLHASDALRRQLVRSLGARTLNEVLA